MNQKCRDNLRSFIERIRKEKLFLAVHYLERTPQLIITLADPLKNEGVETNSFFVFSFVVPSEGREIKFNQRGIIGLKIYPIFKEINGICDSMMRKMSPFLEENIKKIKEI